MIKTMSMAIIMKMVATAIPIIMVMVIFMVVVMGLTV